MPSMFRSLAIPAAAVKSAQKKGETHVASVKRDLEKDETPVAADEDAISMRDQEKVGAKCCGCLCDYRRAVVAISIVGIVWNIIAIIIFALGSGAAAIAANADSLDLSEEDQENFRATTINAGVVAVIGNPYNGTGAITGGIIGSIIGYGLWLYPVIGLITEIKSGLMSKETYPREAQKFK
ncbi:hypothetical protein FRACYDRAFT_238361 [Fragilariopsis cylindrus CCMP1102]|uniref:Uncharacterized protein n=1 Tax=Fragilariopsis cylindrus CCMP1102 TaxID=635003 RepID=A0A1E7FID1_9STRA|nr:hypothetical protein FRACYDRAFT_238361 [Fragilariopsis cylindrus CCMP1102]|eukprot:OEU17931.1 hypothetical protein FRACYDRAFT_238361 [Fragilariopsis cylindrus CCMP1102]